MDMNDYKSRVEKVLTAQRLCFASGKTLDIHFRLNALRKLQISIQQHEQDVLEALYADLHKSPQEGYMTEVSMVLSEIKYHIRHLKKWMKPTKHTTPFYMFPSSSYTLFEPLGVVLIMSPWNYPFQLLLSPLVAAISAGNCVFLKPSPSSPHINAVIRQIVDEAFTSEHIAMMYGDAEQTMIVLNQKFDFIFFTGSPSFGKIVMQCAAQQLTPVVLELGGKSPCIIDKDCNINIAARRVVWGKLLNAGQTCIAPDYFLVHSDIEEIFVEALKKNITTMYGEDLSRCTYYPRIINDAAMNRLKGYLQDGDVAFGGDVNDAERYLGPTIIRNVKPNSKIMNEEIFGPIFPIFTFIRLDETIAYINAHPKPLALYYFGEKKVGWEVIRKTSSGGACINDVILHQVNNSLPFGGVGNSGMGKYHGRYGFEAFSNKRSIVKSLTAIDLILKYPPFKYFSLVKKIL